MPLDAICLRAVTNELNNVLAGCRVEKVYQPDRDEIVLQTRGGQGGPRRLLLSIAAGAPRVHFIGRGSRESGGAADVLHAAAQACAGAKIAAVSQPAVERMLTIELDTTDEMGVPCKKHLICELMGKHSNVILCGEDNRIIDALRRVDGDLSGKRQVLPGLFYRMPPAQDKHDPFTVSGTDLPPPHRRRKKGRRSTAGCSVSFWVFRRCSAVNCPSARPVTQPSRSHA